MNRSAVGWSIRMWAEGMRLVHLGYFAVAADRFDTARDFARKAVAS